MKAMVSTIHLNKLYIKYCTSAVYNFLKINGDTIRRIESNYIEFVYDQRGLN